MAQAQLTSPLDLPAEMFRTGDTMEETSLPMYSVSKDEVLFEPVKFSEVNKRALYEGDIVLGPADKVRNDAGKGIVIKGTRFRWPKATIPYIAIPALQARVKAAIAEWEKHTPFRFVERVKQRDYLSFEVHDGCWSSVGRQGGKQIISLAGGCNLGAAVHEIGHALGLWHEQSRSDRDEFITILFENIDPNRRAQFAKHTQDGTDVGEYDYASIMHYPATAFSFNNKPTIVTKNGEPIGQRNGLSAGDIAAIKTIYPELDWPA